MNIVKNIIGLTIFFFLLTSQSFSSASASEEHNSLFRKEWTMLASVKAKSNNFSATLKSMSELDVDIAGVDVRNNLIDVLISKSEYQLLIAKGFLVIVNDTKGVTRKPDEEYKNPQEIEQIVKDFADRFPNITHRVSIGKSLEGRDIWAIKISDNASTLELSEPSVLFNSMHHAREIMTPEVSLDIIEYLLTNYKTDNQVTSWVDSTEIWVIPMFNVDGNNKMWNHDSWWRKNTRDGHGVDLNRNYPAGWGSCNGSSGSRSSQTYRGTKPASEPETQAMMNFIAEVRPVFDISYHAYSELVIYPYGCGKKRTQTKEVVEKIGKKIAADLDYDPGTAWELLYNADGGDIDWMYEAYQVIPFVIELNSRKEGFHPRYKKWRDRTVKKNRVGWQYLLNRVHQSGIRGMVTTANGSPLADYKLNVFQMKSGVKVLFQEYVGHTTGMYHLVLNPGKYIVEVMKNKKLLISNNMEVNNSLLIKNIELK